MPTRPESARDEMLTRWSSHLSAIAAPGLSESPPPTHGPFQAWRAGKRLAPPPLGPNASIDDRLWAAAIDARSAPGLGSVHAWIDEVLRGAGGPVRPQGSARTIEVWTECELSAIHALCWLGRLLDRPEFVRRAFDASVWHIENTQPDNATNHPWAIHIFIAMHERLGMPDARLYAETLLHNCQVTRSIPDPLSAHILSDASEALLAVDWDASRGLA